MSRAGQLAALSALLAGAAAAAGEADNAGVAPPGYLEEVVTTATKKSEAEAAQDVAGAISVVGGEQLEALKVTDLEHLAYALPNVALDGIGTGKGIANFSIRGLGVAGSIPSIDPTVGVFVDGMYLGVNYGVITDLVDLEAIEVLRGPQGLLFGRNVTGGAVLLRARRPSGETAGHVTGRLETGPEKRLSGAMEGSFAGGALDARLAASFRDDAGWFDNEAPGHSTVGAESSWVLRPVLTAKPADGFDVTVIMEAGDSDGDGPASQNRRRFSGFGFAIDEPGYSRVDWRHAIARANRQLENGLVTNVLGLRGVRHESLADIDSTPQPVFHLFAFTEQEQISNELRYSGWLHNGWQVTAGGYFFTQEILYRERRVLRGAWGAPFGGNQRHRTGGAFASVDVDLGSRWVLSAGARYTLEKKAVDIATAGAAACDPDTDACRFDFVDDDSWRNVTPRLSLQHWLRERVQLYGQYTRGFRSGGYNLRNTSPTASPGPFDEEEQDSIEVGYKAELPRLRVNLAVFHNRVYGLQRQVTRADVVTGGIQVTANTADATIRGVEAEATAAIGEACNVAAFVGITDGAYDRVRHDLDGDGSTAGDTALKLPRLAPRTYGAHGHCCRPLAGGELGVRFGIAHRDDSEITDDNRGVLDGADLLDASVVFSPSASLSVTLYGRNLLGEVTRRSDLDLSGLVDSTYSPLKEGRVAGLEVRVDL